MLLVLSLSLNDTHGVAFDQVAILVASVIESWQPWGKGLIFEVRPEKASPQGLKPVSFIGLNGTTEVVP
jgi:hypothetical protein